MIFNNVPGTYNPVCTSGCKSTNQGSTRTYNNNTDIFTQERQMRCSSETVVPYTTVLQGRPQPERSITLSEEPPTLGLNGVKNAPPTNVMPNETPYENPNKIDFGLKSPVDVSVVDESAYYNNASTQEATKLRVDKDNRDVVYIDGKMYLRNADGTLNSGGVGTGLTF